ncbi:MAG: DUF6624 domain-containing protein [Cytophagales bacterium]|nr:DUF6624 domain-containing protein [Cytophagales bacterium]
MKQASLVLLLSILGVSCTVSESEWSDVRSQLTEIKKREYLHRREMDSIGKVQGWQSREIERLWGRQKALDSINLAEVNEILDTYGFPSRDKVGDLAETIFLVLQHSSDMGAYYEMIVGAGKNGDLAMKDVAPYQDRVLLARRVPQEYGTQVWIDYKVDTKTAERYDSLYVWEIRDRKNVNVRRLNAGLDSLETSMRRFDIDPAVGYVLRKNSNR